MSFTMTASSGGGKTEKAPPGNHLAVLVAVVDLGTQEHDYQGKVSWRRDVYLCWELAGEQIAGTTKNHLIGTAVTMSLNDKATLRKWVEARTGRKITEGEKYDLSAELGQPCLLNVVANQSGYPRVEGVAAVPKGLPAPKPTYEPFACSLEEFQAGKDLPDWLPWHYGSQLAEHVKASREIGGAKPQPKSKQTTEQSRPEPMAASGNGGEIPF